MDLHDPFTRMGTGTVAPTPVKNTGMVQSGVTDLDRVVPARSGDPAGRPCVDEHEGVT